jgi:hypothetical protein
MSTLTAPPSGLALIGEAIRAPEQLVLRWRDRARDAPAQHTVFVVLGVSTLLSLLAYGFTMGVPTGLHSIFTHSLYIPLIAVVAWGICLPSLYILTASSGSQLDRSTTFLAALVAMHFGSVARLASAPLSWFFGVALPNPMLLTAVHVLVFGITALGMVYAFLRVLKKAAPELNTFTPLVWLCCVGLIDVELKAILHIFAT